VSLPLGEDGKEAAGRGVSPGPFTLEWSALPLPSKPLSNRLKLQAEQWLPLAYKLAGKAKRQFTDIPGDDIDSMATDALISAVSLYKPERGLPLGAWLGWAIPRLILNGIREHLRVRGPKKQWPAHEDGRLVEFGADAPPAANSELLDDLEKWIDPRHLAVLVSRRGLDVTLRDLAPLLGVSAERVRQIEEAALSTARRRLRRHAP
jgi:RNA polymerase sigma factor (sigma-70 family)